MPLFPSWPDVVDVVPVPAGLVPPNKLVVEAGVVVLVAPVVAGADVVVVVLVAGAVVDAGFENKLVVVVAGVVELVEAALVVVGFRLNRLEVVVETAAGADVEVAEDAAGAVVVVVGKIDLVVSVVEDVGAVVVAGVAPAVVPKSGFCPVAGALEAGVLVPEVPAAGWALPNNDGVLPAADVPVGLDPKRLLAPAVVPLPDCDGAEVDAGVVDWPNRLVVPVEAAGFDPNKLLPVPAVLVASVGGASAGVVEPSPPKIGFAGVAWPAGVVEPNKDPPVLPKSPVPVEVVPDPDWEAVVAEVPCVEGAVVVAVVLFPKRLGVDVGVAAPEAGVEVLPNKPPPAGLLAPPNRLPPDDAPVVWPNNDVPDEGAEVEGVVVLVPVLPKRPPFWPVAVDVPPNTPPPV